MEPLIFVGIVLLFSVLEAVARKGRADQGGREGPPLPEEPHQRRPRPEPRPRAEPRSGTVPHSYDEDPSQDDAARGDEDRWRPGPATVPAPPAETERPRTGSEGLIPSDVWDEIQRMARGEVPEPVKAPPPRPAPPPAPAPEPRRMPESAPRRPAESRSPESRPPGWPKPSAPRKASPARARPSQRAGAPSAQPRTGKRPLRPAPAPPDVAPAPEGTADHPVHLAHEAFGTAPSHRAGIPLEGRVGSAPSAAAEVRKLLAADRRSLRHAVVLQEILGPPPGLREG